MSEVRMWHQSGGRWRPAALHSLNPERSRCSISSPAMTQSRKPWLWTMTSACLAIILYAGGCGGDLPRRNFIGPSGDVDGGATVGTGRGNDIYGCVDEAYEIVLFAAFDDHLVASDVEVEFVREDRVSTPASVSPPAKGSAGADEYFVAKLVSAEGGVEVTYVFRDARLKLGDGGVLGRVEVSLAMVLKPGITELRVENWETDQVLLDLDLRGHFQILCVDRPCLSICRAPDGGIDVGGGSSVVDSGVVESVGPEDAESVDGATDTATDALSIVDANMGNPIDP